jgi:hypothetical protein
MKALHQDKIVVNPNHEKGYIKLEKDLKDTKDSIEDAFLYTYDDNIKSCMVVSYILQSRYLRELRRGGKCRELAESIVKFMLTEYGNPIAALLFLYESIYSIKYLKEETVESTIRLQNLLHLCKQTIINDMSATLKLRVFEKVSFEVVLNFRRRVQQLKATVKNCIVRKMDLYSLLIQSKINFEKLMIMGSEIVKLSNSVKLEIDDLMNYQGEIIDLVRQALLYELCVEERPIISDKLRKRYQLAIEDSRRRVSSVDPEIIKTRSFSYLNSTNLVLFVRKYNEEFRICKFTANASQYLEIDKSLLQGAPLNGFIPKSVAQVHDKLLTNFINGNSYSQRNGYINGVIITDKGKAKSVVLLIKLEILFTTEVYYAALIINRQKNGEPLVLTDTYGNILALNKKSINQLGINQDFHSAAFFALFPRLMPLYFPNSLNKLDFLQTLKSPKFSSYKRIDYHYNNSLENQPNQDNLNTEPLNSRCQSETIEVFYFQILSTLLQTQLSASLILPEDNPLHRSPPHWLGNSKVNISGSDMSPLQSFKSIDKKAVADTLDQEDILRCLAKQRNNILSNLSKVFTAKVNIETNYYQNRLVLKEVTFSGITKLPNRLKQFIKMFARSNESYLTDVLVLSPDSLSAICQICDYEARLQGIREKLKTDQEKFEKRSQLLDSNKVSNDKSNRKILKSKASGLNSSQRFTYSSMNMLTSEKSPVNITQSLLNLGKLENEKKGKDQEEDSLSLELSGDKICDIFHANIKPLQSDSEEILPEDEHQPSYRKQSKVWQRQSYKESEPGSNTSPNSPVRGISPNSRKESNQFYLLNSHFEMEKLEHRIQLLKESLAEELNPEKIEEIINKAMITYSSRRSSTVPNTLPYHDSCFANSTQQTKQDQSSRSRNGNNTHTNLSKSSSLASGDHKDDLFHHQTDRSGFKNFFDLNSALQSQTWRTQRAHNIGAKIKSSILRSERYLALTPLQVALFGLFIIMSLLKILFKVSYDTKIQQIYTKEKYVNEFGDLLRPAGFIYKESVKMWLADLLEKRQNYINESKLFREYEFAIYLQSLNDSSVKSLNLYTPEMYKTSTFLAGAPPKPISVFTYLFTVNVEFDNLHRYKFKDFILAQEDALQRWVELRFHARTLFAILFTSFENTQDKSATDLISAFNYIIYNFLCNVIMIMVELSSEALLGRTTTIMLREHQSSC